MPIYTDTHTCTDNYIIKKTPLSAVHHSEADYSSAEDQDK